MLVSANIRASNFCPAHYSRARLSNSRDVAERSQAKIGRAWSGEGGGKTKGRESLPSSLHPITPRSLLDCTSLVNIDRRIRDHWGRVRAKGTRKGRPRWRAPLNSEHLLRSGFNRFFEFSCAHAHVLASALSFIWLIFSKRTGTSVDDRKASEKDWTRLPEPNLPLCHWSSQLFDLRAPSSADVPVMLLSQGKRYCCQYNLAPRDLSSLTLAQENEYERTLGMT